MEAEILGATGPFRPMPGGGWSAPPGLSMLYVFISLSAVCVLALMAVCLLSAALKLFHRKKRRGAGYIIFPGGLAPGSRRCRPPGSTRGASSRATILARI